MSLACFIPHRPASRIIGWDMRLENIWKATSMPTVKPSLRMTRSAPMHRMLMVMICSRALTTVLKKLRDRP